MNEEQRKVRKFYKQFLSWRSESIGVWIGAGFLVMFMLVGCAVPVQEILEGSGTSGSLMLVITMFSAILAGVLYLRPYQGYMENQKTETILSKLKYVPVDFKEIFRMKLTYMIRFFAIICPFCLMLQVLTSGYSYGEITWKNVAYVFVVAFVWPVLGNLWILLFDKEISIQYKFTKIGKIIIVLSILVLGAIYVLFPRNVKDLVLKGADEENVTIEVGYAGGDEYVDYELSTEQKEKMLALFEKSYIRVKLFPEKSVSKNFMGYDIYISDNQDMIYFFAEDIISINGRQYVIYGDGMAEEFREIIENES